MAIKYNRDAIPGRHEIEYRILDYAKGNPKRAYDVLATRLELEQLARDGYLVRDRLIPEAELIRLRSALEETIAGDNTLQHGGATFSGTFVRHMMDKHPTFLELFEFAPTLSVARAMIGPYVQLRGMTARVCYPETTHQEAEWHYHQRVVPDPIPPFFTWPQTIDALIYLDDIDDKNGPLCVLPGSHLFRGKTHETGDVGDKEGQILLKLRAGSCVLTHGSLWHRALPTQPGATLRRMLIIGYGPCCVKQSIYGKKPEDGLMAGLVEGASEETLELLGLSGFM